MHTQPSDRDIKTSLEEMDERLNQRLDTVEVSINDCCNASSKHVRINYTEKTQTCILITLRP